MSYAMDEQSCVSVPDGLYTAEVDGSQTTSFYGSRGSGRCRNITVLPGVESVFTLVRNTQCIQLF